MLAMTRGSLPFDERIDPRRLADQLAEALRRVDARDVIATVDRVSFRGGVFRSVSNWNVLVPFSHGELIIRDEPNEIATHEERLTALRKLSATPKDSVAFLERVAAGEE